MTAVSLAFTVETLLDSLTQTGAVPFDRELDHDHGNNKECSEGVLFSFRRDDAGEGGAIEVTWSVRAAIDRTVSTVPEDATITIEP